MTTNSYRTNLNDMVRGVRVNRGLAFGAIITTALLAFEVFNYGTTDYALTDLLGELKFAGLRWATILAIAFCGIDFAGIARLFAPELGPDHNENWFLFGAWLLAATMNAMLTWWGVSLAILSHQATGDVVIGRETMIHIGPVFVAVLVWLIRVLIIGTFSVSGDRLFGANTDRPAQAQHTRQRPLSRPEPAAMDVTPARPPLTRPRPSRPLINDTSIIESTPIEHTSSERMPVERKPVDRTTLVDRPSQNRTQVERSPIERTPFPRRSTPLTRNTPPPPPEPEYTDDDETGFFDPTYTRAPLAARPSGRPQSSNPGISEGPASRTPIPRRRS